MIGYGEVDIAATTSTGKRTILRLCDVALCEGFACNIISFWLLQKGGIDWDTRANYLIRWDNSEVCKLIRREGQYVVEYLDPLLPRRALWIRRNALTKRTERPPTSGSADLWHRRLGHAGPESIAHLPASATGVKVVPRRPRREGADTATGPLTERGPTTTECEACALGKLTRIESRAPRERAAYPGERWALDFFEYEEDNYGYRYLFLIVDRLSGFIYADFLHLRSGGTIKKALDKWLMWLKNQYRLIPKAIECDNEVPRTRDIEAWLSEFGIIFEPSAPRTQQQNGGAERSGGMVKAVAATLRAAAKFPEFLWPEIVAAAIYLLNRTPKQRLNWKSPYESFHEYHASRNEVKIAHKKPYLGHLKAYGCKAYVATPDTQKGPLAANKTRKLKPKAWIGYLIGYDSTNIYRIWVPYIQEVIEVEHDGEYSPQPGKRVIRTRDVVFDEESFFDGNINTLRDDIRQVDENAFTELIYQVRLSAQERENSCAQPSAEDENTFLPGRSLQERLEEMEGLQSELARGEDEEIPSENNLPTGFKRRTPAGTDHPSRRYEGPLLSPESESLTPHHLLAAGAFGDAEERAEPAAFPTVLRPPDRRMIRHRNGPWEAAFLGGRSSGTAVANQRPVGMKKLIKQIQQGKRTTFIATKPEERSKPAAYAPPENTEPAMGRLHRRDLEPPPKTYRDYLLHPHKHLFRKAMEVHIEGHRQMRSWEERYRSHASGHQLLDCMWVWTYKFDKHGILQKAKARLVVRGDQQAGSILESTYAATLAGKSFRTLVSIAARFDLEMIQYDVVNAFVHADLPYDIFMRMPPGFEKRDTVLLLKKALYGLRESPLLWQRHLTTALKEAGYSAVPHEPCCYTKKGVFIFYYVDDIVIAFGKKYRAEADALAAALKSSFALQGGEDLQWFLGIEIIRDRENRVAWLSQSEYIQKLAHLLISKTNKAPHTPMTTTELLPSKESATLTSIYNYQRKVGSLMYAAVITRPDVAFTVSRLARHNHNPGVLHHEAADRAIRYLLGTRHYSLKLGGGDHFEIYSDASFADNLIDRRSSQAYVIRLFGGVVGWRANKQDTVTTSTTEAELLALSQAVKEGLFVSRLLQELCVKPDGPERLRVWCDNTQTIRLVNSEIAQLQTKLRHVDIHNHWLRERAQRKEIEVLHCPTGLMLADGLTKALPADKFAIFRDQVGVENCEERIKERKLKEMTALEIEELEDLFTGGEVEIPPGEKKTLGVVKRYNKTNKRKKERLSEEVEIASKGQPDPLAAESG